MQFITGNSRHQTYFSTLKDQLITHVAYKEQPSVNHITKAFLSENFNYYKATDSYNCPSGAILQALAHGTIKKLTPMKRVAVLKLIAFALVTNNFQAFYN